LDSVEFIALGIFAAGAVVYKAIGIFDSFAFILAAWFTGLNIRRRSARRPGRPGPCHAGRGGAARCGRIDTANRRIRKSILIRLHVVDEPAWIINGGA
jgi:hypothetical protein